MQQIEDLVEELQQEALEYLDNGPIDYSNLIFYDNLYNECYDRVLSNLADRAEALAEEEKYKDYDET